MKTNLETALEKMDDWMLLKHRDRKTRQAYRLPAPPALTPPGLYGLENRQLGSLIR
jgi:hypothetical protein